MAEDSGVLESLGKVIPSMYYDLIARVCVGVPFLVMLLWNPDISLDEITWEKLVLLFGAGYITGLVLTSLTFVFVPVDLAIAVSLKIHINNWQWTDEISARDKDMGATLAKMHAEKMLCQSLFCAFLLLILSNWVAIFRIPSLDALPTVYRWAISLMLGFAAIFRAYVYLRRLKHLHQIYAPIG
jgi:hypothetical protein